VLPEVAAVMASQRAHLLSFVGLGKAAFVPDAHGTVLNQVFAPSGKTSIPGLPLFSLFCSRFAMQQNLQISKKLQIKTQKNGSSVDISLAREQNSYALRVRVDMPLPGSRFVSRA
jgi:hypothetical protein